MDVRFGVFKTRKAMRTNVVRKNHHLTPGSGICGYATGRVPKPTESFCFMTLKMPDRLLWTVFLLALIKGDKTWIKFR